MNDGEEEEDWWKIVVWLQTIDAATAHCHSYHAVDLMRLAQDKLSCRSFCACVQQRWHGSTHPSCASQLTCAFCAWLAGHLHFARSSALPPSAEELISWKRSGPARPSWQTTMDPARMKHKMGKMESTAHKTTGPVAGTPPGLLQEQLLAERSWYIAPTAYQVCCSGACVAECVRDAEKTVLFANASSARACRMPWLCVHCQCRATSCAVCLGGGASARLRDVGAHTTLVYFMHHAPCHVSLVIECPHRCPLMMS